MRATLDDWVRAVRRVVLESAVILSADDAETLAEAVALARAHGASVEMLPDGRAVVRVPDGDDASDRLAEGGGPHAGLEAAAGVCQSPRIVATMGCNSVFRDLLGRGLI